LSAQDKTAVFVDVQNIYYTVRQTFACHFNYAKFWRQISSESKISHAFAYAVDRGDKKQNKFQQILKDLGFEVKLKPYIQRKDGSAKGDWDVGITIDMLEYSDKVDRMVLASGDGDFDLLVRKIRQCHSIRVDVFGVEALTANSLKNSASNFYSINNQLLLYPQQANQSPTQT